MLDAFGNLYGTTAGGGNDTTCQGYSVPRGCGVVFKLDVSGNFSVVHVFGGKSAGDGSSPASPLMADAAGNVYGLTLLGGTAGDGTLFRIDTAGNLKILHSFSQHSDGAAPQSALTMNSAGDIFGLAQDVVIRSLSRSGSSAANAPEIQISTRMPLGLRNWFMRNTKRKHESEAA